jgi:hypothetical protein
VQGAAEMEGQELEADYTMNKITDWDDRMREKKEPEGDIVLIEGKRHDSIICT